VYPLDSPPPLCLAHLRFVHSEVMRDLVPDRIGHQLFGVQLCVPSHQVIAGDRRRSPGQRSPRMITRNLARRLERLEQVNADARMQSVANRDGRFRRQLARRLNCQMAAAHARSTEAPKRMTRGRQSCRSLVADNEYYLAASLRTVNSSTGLHGRAPPGTVEGRDRILLRTTASAETYRLSRKATAHSGNPTTDANGRSFE
jgi:hypothetical protein